MSLFEGPGCSKCGGSRYICVSISSDAQGKQRYQAGLAPIPSHVCKRRQGDATAMVMSPQSEPEGAYLGFISRIVVGVR